MALGRLPAACSDLDSMYSIRWIWSELDDFWSSSALHCLKNQMTLIEFLLEHFVNFVGESCVGSLYLPASGICCTLLRINLSLCRSASSHWQYTDSLRIFLTH